MMNTKKCPYCLKLVLDGDQECPHCHGLLAYCSQCGALMKMGQIECGDCHFRVFWTQETERCAKCGAPMQFHPSELCPTCRKQYTKCSKCGKICEISKDGLCAECRNQSSEGKRWILLLPIALVAVVLTVILAIVLRNILFQKGAGEERTVLDRQSPFNVSSLQEEESGEQDTEQKEQEPTVQVDETPAEKPEVPDCVGYSYAVVSSQLQNLDPDLVVTYEYNSTVNRGCVVSAQWEGDHLAVILSKGLEHSFYSMSKVNGDGSVDYTDLYLVDQDGLHSKAYKYDGGGKQIYSFEFDYEGMAETAQYFYEPGGTFHHHWEFEYDKHGRLRKEIKFDGSGKEINRSEFEYDSKGRITQRTDYANGDLTYRWKMTDYDDYASPCSYCTHVYGNWTRAEIYDPKGNKIRRAIQTFDSYGAVECLAINTWDGALIYEYVFESADVDGINEETERVLNQLGN